MGLAACVNGDGRVLVTLPDVIVIQVGQDRRDTSPCISGCVKQGIAQVARQADRTTGTPGDMNVVTGIQCRRATHHSRRLIGTILPGKTGRRGSGVIGFEYPNGLIQTVGRKIRVNVAVGCNCVDDVT